MPTFNRLKEKQPTAELKWFQSGKLWASRHDAQEALRSRSRESAPRTGSDPAAPRAERAWNAKPEWKTRSSFKPREDRGPGSRTPDPARSEKPYGQARSDRKPEWKPKGTFKPKEAGHASGWGEKPGWKPKGSTSSRRPSDDRGDKPAWSPKGGRPSSSSDRSAGKPAWQPKPGGSARDQARSSFRPKSYTPKTDDGMTRSSRVQSKGDKLEWKPASAKASTFAKAPADRSARQASVERRSDGPNAGFAKSDPNAPKRKWVPKAEYKKSLGIEAKRDDKWRPGGEHKDPKQKYKDAKKAKWGRFKEAIRSRGTKPRKRED